MGKTDTVVKMACDGTLSRVRGGRKVVVNPARLKAMTEAQVLAAAKADPDNRPLTAKALAGMKPVALLDGHRFAEVVPENRDVDIFGEAMDQAMGFGQGRAALEEQAGPIGRPLVVERIQGPADPEVLFDIADGSAEPVGRRKKEVEPVAWRHGDDLLVRRLGHGCASSTFGKPSRSRRNSCIQIGRAENPARRSSRIACPCSGLPNRRRSRVWTR